jgi:hypothetical protein
MLYRPSSPESVFALCVALRYGSTQYFAKELNACPQDRFGGACDHRYSKSLEFLPAFLDRAAPGVDANLARRRRSCASAWFQQWLCALPAEPKDLSGITVGKTVLQRAVRSYEATLDRRKLPRRPIFDTEKLARWPWRPTNLAPLPLNQRACVYGGVDWGGEHDEAWLLKDACPVQQFPAGLLAIGPTGSGSGGGGTAAFLRAGEDVLRSAVHASNSGSDQWPGGYSSASLWWAGQLAVHSLASFGKCSVLRAQQLLGGAAFNAPATPPMAKASASASRSNGRGQAAKGKLGGSSRSSVGSSGGGPIVSMHIRRGDSCMRWATKRGDWSLAGGRPCFATSLYLAAARQLRQQYGCTQLRLATDSAAAAAQVATALEAEDWTVTRLQYDRALVGGKEGANGGKRVDQGTVYIEDRLKGGDAGLDQELVIGSLLAELDLLSGGHILVGTSSSWVTRLAFLMMLGRRGTAPPFIFLDAPFGCLNIKSCTIK